MRYVIFSVLIMLHDCNLLTVTKVIYKNINVYIYIIGANSFERILLTDSVFGAHGVSLTSILSVCEATSLNIAAQSMI